MVTVQTGSKLEAFFAAFSRKTRVLRRKSHREAIWNGIFASYSTRPRQGVYCSNVLIVFALTIVIFIYLYYSKHGYEISVVGESQNTARYIGINVKKVFIRTMILSGALCGVVGMLLVAGTDHSIDTNTVGGQGFTAIMVSWLGQFNPLIMIVMSALVIFLNLGSAKVADSCRLNSSYADIAVGIVILIVVGCEFFIRYSIRFRNSKKEGAK